MLKWLTDATGNHAVFFYLTKWPSHKNKTSTSNIDLHEVEEKSLSCSKFFNSQYNRTKIRTSL